jgi:hypothetical protein
MDMPYITAFLPRILKSFVITRAISAVNRYGGVELIKLDEKD